MTDSDDITFYDIAPKYQERLLKWLSSARTLVIEPSTEGFKVYGGSREARGASLEAAINEVIGSRARRGQLEADFEERVRAWLTENHAVMSLSTGNKPDEFYLQLDSGERSAGASDEDLEVALVLAEDDFMGESGETEPPTRARPAVTRRAPEHGARTVRGPSAKHDDALPTLREFEPPTEEAPTRLFGGEADKTLAVPYSANRMGRGGRYSANRRESYGAWVADVSDGLDAMGSRFDDASVAYWRQLYQAGFSPDQAIQEFGQERREHLGIRANAAPPAPSSRHRGRGHESALHGARRIVAQEESERRRQERPFDPEAPREHYAKSYHFAVNARERHADKDILREVTLGDTGYVLVLWDTNRRQGGKDILGYAFYLPGESEPLFEGEDFGASPMHAVDSDETLRSLLGFLTLRPGDTDREYFQDYTQRQIDFMESAAEELSMFAMHEPEYAEAYPLVDVS